MNLRLIRAFLSIYFAEFIICTGSTIAYITAKHKLLTESKPACEGPSAAAEAGIRCAVAVFFEFFHKKTVLKGDGFWGG